MVLAGVRHLDRIIVLFRARAGEEPALRLNMQYVGTPRQWGVPWFGGQQTTFQIPGSGFIDTPKPPNASQSAISSGEGWRQRREPGDF